MPRVQNNNSMRILQANLHRSRVADALLDQIVAEKAVDAVIISEQYAYTSRSNWFEDETKTSAIWLPSNSGLMSLENGSGPGFTYVKLNGLTVISCYLTPSDSIREFEAKLEQIEDKAREVGGSILMAGDFNSRATDWGMVSTNSRGRHVLDMAARLGLAIANNGSTTTFRRPGCIGTTPDITLVSEELLNALRDWHVLEEFTGSDHQYMIYRLETNRRSQSVTKRKGTRVWNVTKLNPERLISTIGANANQLTTGGYDLALVENTMKCIIQGCNSSMPKISTRQRKSSVYWWTEEISELRRECLRRRRRLTRAKRHGPALEEAAAFKAARKDLKIAIIRSKRLKWEELRNDLNSNPWGMGYKIVIRKLGARPPLPELDSSTMTDIVKSLFPRHELSAQSDIVLSEEDQPPLFTIDELRTAARGLKSNKSPGPDGVPAEVLKIIALEKPKLLLDMYNTCLQQGVFPTRWKKQQLILISKGKGDPSQASAYRPLCMLDSAGKLLERLLKFRLDIAVKNAGGLSESQHGFREGRSTIGAINDVIAKVKTANNNSRQIVLLATLDVKNAFNSLRWANVLDVLRTRFSVSKYLLRMLQSYLSDRQLIYYTSQGKKTIQITSGAAQGSILGPDLWNISYDDIFRIEMPDNTYLIGYADDVAAVIIARNAEEARRRLNQTIIRTQSWLEDRGLQLATEKTELILLTRQHIPLEMSMKICDATLRTKKVVNYLGIRLDSRLTFWAQIQYSAAKASKITGLLSRLMANVGGPIQSRRKLLMETTNSIMLYGGEVWADALRAECRRKVLAAVQRTAALRVASAYRTVSEPAVLVISGTTPIDLLAFERKRRWESVIASREEGTVELERRRSLQEWQQRWNAETRGRWTRRIIPDISRWVQRKFGEVNYYLTQLLSGHGYFCQYLCRMGKIRRPDCIYGDCDIDDAEHTFFHCRRWSTERTNLEAIIGLFTPENLCEKMLLNEESWNAVARYAERVLKTKKRDLDCRN